MRSLRLPSRCRRSSCRWPGRGFRAPAFLGPSRAKTSPIVHRYITHMTVISASIMPLAALFFTPLRAWSSLCALEALRWVVGGETMTTPGGTRTPCQSVPATPPCSAHRLLSWAGAPWLTGLRSFALPHPKHLSTLSASSAVLVHKTRRYGHPSRAVLALSGRGYAELRHNGVLGSPTAKHRLCRLHFGG